MTSTLSKPLREFKVYSSISHEKILPQFRRIHSTGSEVIISQHRSGWRYQINLSEPNHHDLMRIVGSLMPSVTIAGFLLTSSVDIAQKLADEEVVSYGHICSASCKGWVKHEA